MPALVVLNTAAHGGTAARRFALVRRAMAEAFDASVVVDLTGNALRTQLRAALDRGVRVFISAGGDGTAHALVNALADTPGRPPLDSLTLGAVGLGSSNDLLKPASRRVGGVPVRLDALRAAPRDLIACAHRDAAGVHHALVLVSASLGLVACANARFQANSTLARALRRASTSAAIGWAAARTLVGWRNVSARLCIDSGAEQAVALGSLSVLKTEWLSGRLRFGHPVAPASGDFDVALAEGLGRRQLGADMLALLRGRFDGRRGHRRLRARSLDVWLDRTGPLELDGEIVEATEAHFGMFTERIRLCA